MKVEVRLSGSGGQGLILAGIILAEGAISSKLNAVQTQSYGPEARGGASKSEVIISDSEINFPKILKPKILLSLTQKSLNEYLKDVDKSGIIVVDSSIEVECREIANIYKFPIIDSSKEVMGSSVAANMVALGVLSQLIDDIDTENIKKSMIKRVPKGTEKLNIAAFEKGIELFNMSIHANH
ncbi:2-oxoacid:acceptor oxidoreductase family protein [Romboutsia sedimentorum]|uniref:2-oxoacid:acceptor oxidoreductase family protein n=1 Tax=Romboutsia sedimentorum TaxID=1368474 RepID=A0ABT7EDJ0_9FIRM|nr:2-oxoacid:acceptor oxidoreductase family protein [Romboutsia sedimentorum]MDK2564999.1 2-oxoacid:acceptor oxidoreductase family protein [Romboutsia sedimentorum]MDK2585483.1 2-oxoacid:acceptor oxidoreductase family protein [Romboutsia sedimentorum]